MWQCQEKVNSRAIRYRKQFDEQSFEVYRDREGN